jgi:translation initiation factor IF-1
LTNYLEIPYEALGPDGRERSRYACTIGELPHSMRLQACEDATKRIAHLIGRESTRRIPFGMPVYVAFSMRPADADRHKFRAVLRMRGADLPLTYCMIEAIRAVPVAAE